MLQQFLTVGGLEGLLVGVVIGFLVSKLSRFKKLMPEQAEQYRNGVSSSLRTYFDVLLEALDAKDGLTPGWMEPKLIYIDNDALAIGPNELNALTHLRRAYTYLKSSQWDKAKAQLDSAKKFIGYLGWKKPVTSFIPYT